MPRRLLATLVVALAVWPYPPLSAQPRLDLHAAMAEVDANHPLAIAKREEFRAAESGLSAAKQQRLPTLSVQSSRPNTVNASTLNVARVQQPLYAGGRIDAGIDRGEALIADAQAALEATRRDLMIRTVTSFIEVVKGSARLKIAEKSVQEHERLLESMGRRVGAEVNPESDLLLTRSRLSQAQTERSQVALNLRRAQDTLSELLNRPAPDLVAPQPQRLPFTDVDAALSAAMAFSPEVRRSVAQEQVAAADFDLAKSAALPSVFVRHEQLVGGLDPGYVRSQTYLGVEFIPGAGLSTGAQIKAADNRRRSAIESRRAAEKDLRDRIRGLWAESESLKTQLASAQGYVQSAQSVADSFSRQFTIGRKSWLEVLNAIREWLLAELSYTEISWNTYAVDYRLAIESGLIKTNP